MVKRAQLKIQQMAFMLIATLIFFSLVAVFFINISFKDVNSNAAQLQKDAAIASLASIADMSEFNCDSKKSNCLDEDKLRVLVTNLSAQYEDFWPVASIKVFKVFPVQDSIVECPAANCNMYDIFDNGQQNKQEFATVVSLCQTVKEINFIYDRCELAKLVVGVNINDE